MRPIRRFMNRTEVDESALAELIFYRHTAGVKSNLKGIDMLAGGEVMRFSIRSGNVQKTSFCDPLNLLQNEQVKIKRLNKPPLKWKICCDRLLRHN